MPDISVPLSRPLDDRKRDTLRHIVLLARANASPPMLVGAFVRDLWFWHLHGLETSRATEDIDISMEFPDWQGFDGFRDVLLGDGFVQPDREHPEKLVDPRTAQKVDLLPFGRLSDDGRSIVWPVDGSRWGILGFEESFAAAAMLAVGPDPADRVRVATLPAFVLLKLAALYERPEDRKRKDGADIGFTMEHYVGAGNAGRLEAGLDADATDQAGGDLLRASALLLGRDVGRLAGAAAYDNLAAHLRAEIGSASRCVLATELRKGPARGDFRRARQLAGDLLAGMETGRAAAIPRRP